MTNFSKALPVWLAKGIEPPQTNKQEGWKASQKPPADWFNWFFFRTYEALKELQDTAALDADVKAHIVDKSNPHNVTKAQIGLGNVANVQQASQVDFNSHVGNKSNPHNVTKAQLGLDKVDNVQQASKVDFDSHKADKANPHGVTKEQIGLNAVQNYPVATKEQAEAGNGNAYMTPLTTQQAINVAGKALADAAKQEAIDTSINKNGDDVPGTINFLNANPINICVGELRHYIGAQSSGTVIRIYFGKTWGEWTEYLDVTVGGEAVKSDDGNFLLDALTTKSAYATGLTPPNYKASKSVINGVEKSADQTITKTNVFSLLRNNRDVEFFGKGFTFDADTTINGTVTAWGINANGFAKVNGSDVLTNAITQFADLNNAIAFGIDGYVNANALNAPVDLGTDTQGSIFAMKRSSTSVIQYYTHYTGRMFIRYFLNGAAYVHSKSDKNGWVELAGRKGIQEYQLTDASGKLLRMTNVDFDNLDEKITGTFNGYINNSINVPFELDSNGYLEVKMSTNSYGVATYQAYNSNIVIMNRREGTAGWRGWEFQTVDRTQVLEYINELLTPKKEILTPINGFTAESPEIYASYIQRGNIYEVRLKGRINPKGATGGLGVCAKLPNFLCPDTDWAAMFNVPQQSKIADRTAIIYVYPNGNIEVVASGEASIVIGLDSISFETKVISS